LIVTRARSRVAGLVAAWLLAAMALATNACGGRPIVVPRGAESRDEDRDEPQTAPARPFSDKELRAVIETVSAARRVARRKKSTSCS
jgi:hypothetical protein